MSRWAAAVLWLLVSGVPDATSGGIMTSLVIVAPLIAATAADARRTALVAGAVALTIAAGAWPGHREDAGCWIGLTAACAVSVLAVVLAGMRRRGEQRLAQMTAIAQAAQLALLAPLPPRSPGSASRPATARPHPAPGPAGTCMRSSPPGTASG
jgi:hypothetical protein